MKINIPIFAAMALCSITSCAASTTPLSQYYSEHNRVITYLESPIKLNSKDSLYKAKEAKWFFNYEVVKNNHVEVINSCDTLLKTYAEGYKAKSYREQSASDAKRLNCNILDESAKLEASKKSYIQTALSNNDFTKKAPPEFALIISKDDERRLAKAKSWQEMSKIQKVEKLNPDQAIYYDNSGGIQRLTLMAKGDYNQDGIEDAVLYMENSVEGGSYSSTHAYIITRLAENAPYTLLKQL